MNKLKGFIITSILIIMMTVNVQAIDYAKPKHISNPNDILATYTINSLDSNLDKLYKYSKVQVYGMVVDKIGNMAIDDFAFKQAQNWNLKDNYIIYIVSKEPSKDNKRLKLLISSDIRKNFSKQDMDNILNNSGPLFAKGDFNGGMTLAIKNIDGVVTTYTKHHNRVVFIICFVLFAIAISLGLYFFIKRQKRKQKESEDKLRDMIDDANKDNRAPQTGTGSFKTFNGKKEEEKPKSKPIYGQRYETHCSCDCRVASSSRQETRSNRTYEPEHRRPNYQSPATNHTVNHTTVINNNSNNDFVEGMIVGSILSRDSHDHCHEERHHESHSYREPEHHREEEQETTGNYDYNSSSNYEPEEKKEEPSYSYSADSSSSSYDDSSSYDSGSSSDTSGSYDDSSSGDY